MTGVWFDPSTGGQGLTLFQDGKRLTGSFYTYDLDGLSMWTTFVGEITGGPVTVDVLAWNGPALDDATWDNSLVEKTIIGSTTFTPSVNSSIVFQYSITLNGVTVNRTLQLQPFSF